jgi:hypothetical protein
MNKDDLLLSEAYARIQNEGTGARINYMGQGVGAAASNLWQGLKAKGANALAGRHVVDAPTQTAGQAYQAAGGKWLVDDFVKKAQAEITDFYSDAKAMGVDASNIEAIKKTHPQIADQLQKVTGLLDFLKGGGGQAPAGQDQQQAPAGQDQQQAPATQTPAGQEPQAAAAETPKEEPKSLEASTPSGTGPLAVVKHGAGDGNSNYTNQEKNITPTQEEEPPVEKAFTPPPVQDAELVTQKTGGTPEIARNEMEQQFGPSKQAYQSTTPEGQTVSASRSELGQGNDVGNPNKYTKKADGWYQGSAKVGDPKAKILDDLWQKQNKGTQQSSPKQSGGLKTAAQIGAQGGNKTKVNEAFRFWRKF